MAEFKGTKGNWEVTPMLNVSVVKSKMICATQDNLPTQELKANALLISKAPEMLELLINFTKAIPENGRWDYQACMSEAHKLIIEATEL